ncbi:hypothetical protein [Clostridium sporogenes]|uniref:hypothetical protein n=2 Tax=Clostridium sporogenes TaxID=1509 RepID=UPI0013D30A1A|nr:hypothetical protein [Clostridium sporogenes]MCW6124334.1 hypothetical protein [Clostridium sporogenes]NFT27077.1 hypothetical protein [Clostridium sporogenes]
MIMNQVLINHNIGGRKNKITTVDILKGDSHYGTLSNYNDLKKQYISLGKSDDRNYIFLIDYEGKNRIRCDKMISWGLRESLMLEDRIILTQTQVTENVFAFDYNGNLIFEFSNDVGAIFINNGCTSIGYSKTRKSLFFILDSGATKKSYIYEISLDGVLKLKKELPEKYRIDTFIFDGSNFYAASRDTLIQLDVNGQIVKEKKFPGHISIYHYGQNSIYCSMNEKYMVIDKNTFEIITETEQLNYYVYYNNYVYNDKLIVSYKDYNDFYILQPNNILHSKIDKKDMVGYVNLLLSLSNSNSFKIYGKTAMINRNNDSGIAYVKGGMK